ncbi:MAG TPA: xanthine dehydrogenase family protein molybdopterin-binding subunit [Xanthobacteraceae bacterium]|nr:xanthine dehydrogenase family protein molybdopterin-binding subunit [Xanthobacteraceae bacterium]
MNLHHTSAAHTAALIGQPIARIEDPRLLRGEGRFTDDINLPGQAYAAIVRSRHAHGIIKSIDTSAAKKMPGVLAVYTGTDFAGYGPMKSNLPFKNRDGSEMKKPRRQPIPADKVRFVGDPVACVVAESLAQAKDAAEAVLIDIEPLPVVIDPQEAAKPGAPLVYEEVPGNLPLDYHYGDAQKVATAFAAAKHVVRLKLVNSRMIVNAIEPRAAIGVYDSATERFTLYTCSQGVMGLRAGLADIFGVPPEKLRVVTYNVGGSFGMKAQAYPEQVCVLHAARALRRPVKWTDERSTSFLSDNHGRDQVQTAELALDAQGHFLALRLSGYANLGGYMGAMAPQPPTLNIVRNVASVYRTPLLEVSTKCVFTNTTFVSPYRGAGRPEGNYFMERLIDYAAAEIGIDRVELRRRNQIRPRELPYKAASGQMYDSGDFPAILKQALELADWKGFARRRRESKKRGKLRGIGLGCYLEVTAPANKEMGGIRFDPDGGVTIITGTLDYGQGHATPFAQVLSERLGIPLDRIRLLQGDSDQLLAGGGTGGSRSMMNSGAAIVEASAKVIEQGKAIASHVLEASAGDIEFANGRFVVAGTDRRIGILELAEKLRGGLQLPPGTPTSLDVRHVSDGAPAAYPNGCHVAEVEVDPDTGRIEVVRYTAVNDFGTVINPLMVDGQVHGGVVQGLGQALIERTVYDAEGQLLSGSYMDYAMPHAADVPDMTVVSHPIPAKTNPLGVKGCGEAGCAGGLASVMNAVVDALSVYGITHIDMPATPERVWQAIRAAQAKRT